MNFEVCLLFKSNSLMYVSKKFLIRYRFQIYNRPVSLSVKVNESYARDGSFDAELNERPRQVVQRDIGVYPAYPVG
jgi:hypothetical protein